MPVKLQQNLPGASSAIIGVLEPPVALRIAVGHLAHDVAVVVHEYRVRCVQRGVSVPSHLQRLLCKPASSRQGSEPALILYYYYLNPSAAQQAKSSRHLGASPSGALEPCRAVSGIARLQRHPCTAIDWTLLQSRWTFPWCSSVPGHQNAQVAVQEGLGAHQGPAQWLCKWAEYW